MHESQTQVENQSHSSDSSEAVPQHEVNETTESQAPTTRTLNRERKRPVWHTDYVMEGNVAYFHGFDFRPFKTITELQVCMLDGQFAVIGQVVACDELDNFDKNGKYEKKKPLTLDVDFCQFLNSRTDHGKIIFVLQLVMMKKWDDSVFSVAPKTRPFISFAATLTNGESNMKDLLAMLLDLLILTNRHFFMHTTIVLLYKVTR
ncbi:wall-associated receptor kinase-like 1 [Artemisia annua]|uniref:Wall-associated receptor kinase-like 1 n=1 Tax=Artemisia annua TaxID=35608 RepID=A0A2U1NLE7_ARTAN|nr:wall-associated receptor kinase-like 1 [Artemisia annua]